MQLLFDFFPVIAFFIAYKLSDIYVATAVILVAVLAQAAVQWLRHRKLSPMMITSAVLVLIFGGLTLWVHDKSFIQWKPTVLNWLFAAAFLASQFFGEQPLVQRFMGAQISLEAPLWRRLNLAWVAFFLIMGGVNMWVLRNFSEDAWVKFKAFGMIGLTIVFVFIQGLWLASKMPAEAPK